MRPLIICYLLIFLGLSAIIIEPSFVLTMTQYSFTENSSSTHGKNIIEGLNRAVSLKNITRALSRPALTLAHNYRNTLREIGFRYRKDAYILKANQKWSLLPRGGTTHTFTTEWALVRRSRQFSEVWVGFWTICSHLERFQKSNAGQPCWLVGEVEFNHSWWWALRS